MTALSSLERHINEHWREKGLNSVYSNRCLLKSPSKGVSGHGVECYAVRTNTGQCYSFTGLQFK